MSVEISIARREIYTTAGSFDTSVYEIQASEDPEHNQTLSFDDPDDLIRLRDILSHYIKNNIEKPSEL